MQPLQNQIDYLISLIISAILMIDSSQERCASEFEQSIDSPFSSIQDWQWRRRCNRNRLAETSHVPTSSAIVPRFMLMKIVTVPIAATEFV